MTDEYDYLYNHAQDAAPTESLDNAPDATSAPQPESTSVFSQTVFGAAIQQNAPAPQDTTDEPAQPEVSPEPEAFVKQQTDYTQPVQGSFNSPQPEFTQPQPEFTQPQPEFTQAQPEFTQPQPEFTQAQPEFTQPQPEFTQAQPEFTQAQPGFTQPQTGYVQPEPETVHAEPAPEYSGGYGAAGYRNIPPYGQQRTAGYAGGYGGQGQPPYGTQPPYGGAYRPPQPPVQAQQPEKKDKKGLKVFFRILIAVIIIGLVFSVVRLAMDRPGVSTQAQGGEKSAAVTAEANAPELETKASPASSGKTGASGQALTPTQIAAKVRASSVGILVYSGNSSGTAGQGSGVLWKESGDKTYTYIITCAHVVSGSGYTYIVQTEDGKTYEAELVGADAKTDLAVLRIKEHGLSLAEFGDSSALQVGDPVYAIGNPGGTEFFGSFTSGIVSAIDRSVKNTYTMLLIQHTAAINPGNSGGALVNEYGQVIGINSQKIASTDYEGMGFAIPVKTAQSVINALASYGFVKDRPRLGITYAEALNYQHYGMIVKIRGLPSGTLVISEIASDSSLANSEVKSGDMIIKVNGEDMTTASVLLDKIENGKVGDKLTLTICRMDNNYQFKEFTVTATLVEESRQNTQQETTTTQSYYSFDPFDFFNGNFGNYYGNGN